MSPAVRNRQSLSSRLATRSALGRIGVGVVAADLDPAAGHRLDGDIEFVGAVAIDIVDQDLLGVTVAEVGNLDPALSGGRDIAHDPAGLRCAVELVGQARGRVDLDHAVAVQIADFDLVHEGVRFAVDLHDLPAVAGRFDHRDDALVVGRHGETRVRRHRRCRRSRHRASGCVCRRSRLATAPRDRRR